MLRIVILLGLLATACPALADSMTFYMKNEHTRDIALELANPETGKRWPGDDQVYLVEKKDRESVRIECDAGERICYGAWVRGNDKVFWGDGPDHDRSCETCCKVCANEVTETIIIGE